jgi:hypothetical protein
MTVHAVGSPIIMADRMFANRSLRTHQTARTFSCFSQLMTRRSDLRWRIGPFGVDGSAPFTVGRRRRTHIRHSQKIGRGTRSLRQFAVKDAHPAGWRISCQRENWSWLFIGCHMRTSPRSLRPLWFPCGRVFIVRDKYEDQHQIRSHRRSRVHRDR